MLVGWGLDIPWLKGIAPGWITMKVNTALSMVAMGGVLAALALKTLSQWQRVAIRGVALAVVGLAGLSLLEYLFEIDLGIDHAFVDDPSVVGGLNFPGRMAAVTALCFILCGVGTVLGTWRAPPFPMISALGASVILMGCFATAGYVLEALTGQRVWNYTGLAAHTAVCFVILGWGMCGLVPAERRTGWHLGKRETAGIAAGFAIMLLATSAAYQSAAAMLDRSGWLVHRQSVLREIQQITAGLERLTSSEWLYVITAREQLLKERVSDLEATRASMDRLAALTADNAFQQGNLEALRAALDRRLLWAERTIDIRGSEGQEPAQRRISSGEGISLSLAVSGLLAAMREEEYRLLQSDEQSQRRVAATAFLLMPVGAFLSLAILLVGLFILNDNLATRIKVERELAASLRNATDLELALDEHAIVAFTDPRGRITYVNDKFCAISQYSREELLGQDHRIVNSGHHPKAFIHDLWTTIGHGRVWKGEIRNRAKDGSSYWVDTTIVPFLDEAGKPRQYVAIRADVTERKRAEEQIRQLNASLERRVASRTAELEIANQELDSFCHSVSHDLRSPLRGIAGFTRVISENYAGSFDEKGRDYMRRVLAATERMGELIDDLLKLSKVSREELRVERVDLSALAGVIVANLRQSAPERRVEVRISGGMDVQGDARLLRVMLENLLGNAWKFTSRTADARIEFLWSEGAGEEHPTFHIRDNGAGFDMTYAGKLFGAFQRLHAQDEFPGTGIGLATVQRIVHRHGGRIWAEAAVNQGAAFHFSI